MFMEGLLGLGYCIYMLVLYLCVIRVLYLYVLPFKGLIYSQKGQLEAIPPNSVINLSVSFLQLLKWFVFLSILFTEGIREPHNLKGEHLSSLLLVTQF